MLPPPALPYQGEPGECIYLHSQDLLLTQRPTRERVDAGYAFFSQGKVTHFIAGLGTSGTFVGTGRRLRAFNPAIKLISFQPDSAFHGLEGLKHLDSSLVPAIYDASVPHRTMRVTTEDGWDMADRLAREGMAPYIRAKE